jgi:hypothetical protein
MPAGHGFETIKIGGIGYLPAVSSIPSSIYPPFFTHGPPDFGNAPHFLHLTISIDQPRCRRVHAPQQATAKQPRVPRVSAQATRTCRGAMATLQEPIWRDSIGLNPKDYEFEVSKAGGCTMSPCLFEKD